MAFRSCLLFCTSLVAFVACNPKPQTNATENEMEKSTFDWQGHRGARGLRPENTIPAFLLALEYPDITTLELDIAISKDSVVVVSHDPWMQGSICTQPDGKPIPEEDEQRYALFKMTYDEIKGYDCGSKGNSRFPDQQPMKVYKPALREVVNAVEDQVLATGRSPVFYNIEIKSQPEWDGVFTPEPGAFARMALTEVNQLGIHDRVCIQSFDIRALQAVRALDPSVTLAYLIENMESAEKNLDSLGFTPQIYSPYFKLLSPEVVAGLHDKNIKVIPWTVNDAADMKSMIDMGVDGIITDYPNRIPNNRK